MRNFRKFILASSALALLFSTASADAQTVVTQGDAAGVGPVSNAGDIFNIGSIAITSGDATGIGASVSIGAAGAVASTGVSNIGGAPQTPVSLGATGQSVTNSGNIENMTNSLMFLSGGSLSDGASIASSATGAAASVSHLGNNVKILGAQVLGGISQSVVNSGAISNVTQSTLKLSYPGAEALALLGDGASVSFGASGAAASISGTLIEGKRNNAPHEPLGLLFDNDEPFALKSDFDIYQSATNLVSGSVENVLVSDVDVGEIAGAGAAVSVAATGSALSISTASLNGGNIAIDNPGDVSQTVTNRAVVSNNVTNRAVTAEQLSGAGAALQVSASGASASIGSSAANSIARSNFNSLVDLRLVDQTSTNTGQISNSGIVNAGVISGTGASTQIAASGANASLGASSVNGGVATLDIGVTIHQTVRNGTGVGQGDVQNVGAASVGDLSGAGASSRISAAGASASMNVASINGQGAVFDLGSGALTQSVTNKVSFISNTGEISSGALTGNGSSIQIASLGASASIGLSSFGGGNIDFAEGKDNFTNPFAAASTVINDGGITNGTIANHTTIDIAGDLAGLASSASSSAIGASSSFGLSSIGGGTITASLDYNTGAGSISQTVVNHANANGVENYGKINSGSLTGTGSSIQVAAVGSSASVAVSSLAPTTTSFGTVNLGAVTQISRNLAPVTNSGIVTAGMVSGLGSSIGISATGASASISFSSIAGK